jgi:uncharacterized delta-60 repeat protein
MRNHGSLALACLAVSAATLAAAAPGQLDPTFGNHGIVVTSFGNDVRPLDAVLQGDGRLIVVGGLNDFHIASEVAAVIRYLPDGSLDASFGSHGLTRAALTDFENEAEAVVIQADGRIVVLVHALSADGTVDEHALMRFKSNGNPDLTFGSGGRTFISFPHPQFFSTPAGTLLLQPDDRILVGGAVVPPRGYGGRTNPTPPKTALARFTGPGRPDATFGTNGVSEVVAVGEPAALAVLADGTILAASVSQQTAQFTSSGALMSTVVGGRVSSSTGQGTTIFRPDAEFLLAAAVRGPSGRRDLDVSVRLFKVSGALDASFQSPPFDFGAGGPFANLAQALAVESNGLIVTGGLSQTASFSDDFGVARLTPSGSLDARFGTGGTVTTSFPHGGQILAMVVQPDGKIVAVGQAFSNDTAIPTDLALVRYLGE